MTKAAGLRAVMGKGRKGTGKTGRKVGKMKILSVSGGRDICYNPFGG